MTVDLTRLIAAVTERAPEPIVREAALVLAKAMSCDDPCWAMISLGQSAATPRGHLWGDYSVTTPQQEQVLQRGPFRFIHRVPTRPSRASQEELRQLAPGTLEQVFTDDAFLLPIASPLSVSFQGAPATLLIVGGQLSDDPSPEAIALVQVACGLAQREKVMREVEARMREASLLELAACVDTATSRKKVAKAVLNGLHSFVPFEAGVLYLLDPDPGRNEYLIYGASRNENDDDPFASYYSRSDLGFTWEVAMERLPRAGSIGDVPRTARHTNRSALAHVSGRYGAWAVVPFTSNGNTRAVAHIEGVRFLEGAYLDDLELMRRLGERLGTLMDRRLTMIPRQREDHLIGTVEALRAIARSSGPDKRTGLESFARDLFSQIPGVIGLHHESRSTPQIDGLFILRHEQKRFVVEVKAPDSNDRRLGKRVIEQIAGQMEAVGANGGLVVTTARFGMRVTDIVPITSSITILDGPCLERFCILTPSERSDTLHKWLERESGVASASFD